MKNLILALLVISMFALGCGLGSSKGNMPVSTRTFANDADFAKEAMTLLVNGDHSVEGMIDWENFKVSDQDVGSKYNLVPDAGKEAFRSAFVDSFSKSFKSTGASLDKVDKWQEAEKVGDNTKVSVSIPGAVGLVINVTHRDGHQRLASIDVAGK
jgi:hypothetical protein